MPSATVVSCIRLRFLINLAHSTNITWDQANITKWSNIEIVVGIVCACLPSVRVFLVRFLPSMFSTSTEKSQRTGTHNRTARSGGLTSKISGKQVEDNKTIHCTTTFTVDQGSTDDDEMELVGMSDHLKSNTASISNSATSGEDCRYTA
jgi:hypothetical protein